MLGYLRISQDISGYPRISLWGELPDGTVMYVMSITCHWQLHAAPFHSSLSYMTCNGHVMEYVMDVTAGVTVT